MDDYLYNMGQPTETRGDDPGWTEWWVVDENGLHLEYADGYGPESEEPENKSETVQDDDTSKTVHLVIYADEVYESHSKRMHERWEEVFGKIDYKKSRLLDREKEIDERYEPQYYPYPISSDAYDDPDYLDFLQGAIDEYNRWYTHGNGLVADTPINPHREDSEPQEESVVDVPYTDGLILPTPRL